MLQNNQSAIFLHSLYVPFSINPITIIQKNIERYQSIKLYIFRSRSWHSLYLLIIILHIFVYFLKQCTWQMHTIKVQICNLCLSISHQGENWILEQIFLSLLVEPFKLQVLRKQLNRNAALPVQLTTNLFKKELFSTSKLCRTSCYGTEQTKLCFLTVLIRRKYNMQRSLWTGIIDFNICKYHLNCIVYKDINQIPTWHIYSFNIKFIVA